ncbi:helix-turn-helix transcriptional regulator [Crossiella sp. CA-258035]|uniref:helix-turn-helix domain-containing protein n=1 Tax=Crossiella sp. CA-258035 TaxID=2981138 RepID=UPI0024BC1C80|nr:helix-turn-helix transcriptional regulator [Crossiella sp. CA-258035]WHT19417.1 helix-turn-helix transcriptional regulator [Crossiella sp. CA-258035]
MPERPGPATRARRVCAVLRTLRKANRLTLHQVAIALGVSVTKVQRMETGRRGLHVDDVNALLTLYQVPAQQRAELLAQVGAAANPGWWQAPGSRLPADLRQLIGLEDEAAVVRDYELAMVPSLLQTAEYARSALGGMDHRLHEPDLGRQVAATMTRQMVLARPTPPNLHCVVEESALQRPIGGQGVLARQLQALCVLADRPNVTLRVLPGSRGAHPGLRGSMTILEFADAPTLVCVPTAGTHTFLQTAAEVDRAREAWAVLEHLALPPAESAHLLGGYAGELARAS